MRQYKGSRYQQPDGAYLSRPASTEAVEMHGLNRSSCLKDQCALTIHQPLSVCNGLCLAMTHLFSGPSDVVFAKGTYTGWNGS